MARKILCVAEKPAIAKSVAQHLGGGHVIAVFGALLHDHKRMLKSCV
jgi:DNA topoisomerase IA